MSPAPICVPRGARCFAVRETAAGPGPREKLARGGAAQLDDQELVALLLGRAGGGRGQGGQDAARTLLDAGGGLAGTAARLARGERLPRGIGRSGSARLAAAFEIARRLAPAAGERVPVREPDQAVREVRDIVAQPREHVVGLYLDARAGLIARETVAVGSLNVARATPRDLLEPALRHLAAGFLMVHNHPSGNPEPSEDDILFTRSVGRAGALLGVPLWDHVIVARTGHASLRARGVRWDGQD